ncbi:MAG: ferritin family protein [Chitinispirillaceae bacterium]|nr:ferritin family protein [Chitinispirillaceae bacterium]
MDLLGMAKALEAKAVDFYDDLTKKCQTREYRGIFADLAREERKHFEVFEKWQKKEPLPDLEQVLPLVDNPSMVFERLSGQFMVTSGEFFSRSQIFDLALDLEKKSIDLYTEMLDRDESAIAHERALLLKIIGQERNHINTITALADFLRHPGEWLENAEWRHAEEF